MNNRLSLHDIAEILAAQTGKNVSDSELFLHELISIITQRLCSDKKVSVRGLGVLELIRKDACESKFAETGDPCIIPAHYQFRFIPDKDLKALVNYPFSMFEVTELAENVDFSDLQVKTSGKDYDETDGVFIEDILLQPIPIQLVSETAGTPPQKETEEMQPKETGLLAENKSEEIKLREVEQISQVPAKQHRNRLKRYAFLFGLLLLLGISFCLLFRNKNSIVMPSPSIVEVADSDTIVSLPIPVEPDTMVPITSPLKSNDLDTISIQPGDRLTSIALHYYGHKFFWVYIYEYNKDIIVDPNNIPVGTSLRLPSPTVYGINVKDRASVEKAAAKQTEILSNRN